MSGSAGLAVNHHLDRTLVRWVRVVPGLSCSRDGQGPPGEVGVHTLGAEEVEQAAAVRLVPIEFHPATTLSVASTWCTPAGV